MSFAFWSAATKVMSVVACIFLAVSDFLARESKKAHLRSGCCLLATAGGYLLLLYLQQVPSFNTFMIGIISAVLSYVEFNTIEKLIDQDKKSMLK